MDAMHIPPSFKDTSPPGHFQYPKSWEGWTWKDHPSAVARAIFTAFASDPHIQFSVEFPAWTIQQDLFDFMSLLHVTVWTTMRDARHRFSGRDQGKES
jgi:hypothetical protein